MPGIGVEILGKTEARDYRTIRTRREQAIGSMVHANLDQARAYLETKVRNHWDSLDNFVDLLIKNLPYRSLVGEKFRAQISMEGGMGRLGCVLGEARGREYYIKEIEEDSGRLIYGWVPINGGGLSVPVEPVWTLGAVLGVYEQDWRIARP